MRDKSQGKERSENARDLIAFTHIPKSAGITISYILLNSFGVRHYYVDPWVKLPRGLAEYDYYSIYYSAEDHRKIQRFLPNLRSISGHLVKINSDLHKVNPNVRYFTFLRDPLVRTSSQYQFSIQRMGNRKPFRFWVKNENLHNVQTKHIAGCNDVDLAIQILKEKTFFVGLVEFFDESLIMLKKKIGSRLDLRYESRNVAAYSKIKNLLMSNTKNRSILEDINDSDIHLYQYVRNKHYPKQKKEFGRRLASELKAFKSSKLIDKKTRLKLQINEIARFGYDCILSPSRESNKMKFIRRFVPRARPVRTRT